MGGTTSHVAEKDLSERDIMNNISRLFSLRNKEDDLSSVENVNWNDVSDSRSHYPNLNHSGGGQQINLGNILDTDMTMTDQTTNTNMILSGGCCPNCGDERKPENSLYGGMASETEAMKKLDTISSLPETPHTDSEGGAEPEEEEESESTGKKKSKEKAKGTREHPKKDVEVDEEEEEADEPEEDEDDDEDEGDEEEAEGETEGEKETDAEGGFSVDSADVHALPFYSNESTSEFLFPKK